MFGNGGPPFLTELLSTTWSCSLPWCVHNSTGISAGGFEFLGRRLNWTLGAHENKSAAFGYKGSNPKIALQREPFFDNGRRYKFEIRVRKTGVTMLLDDRQVFADPVGNLRRDALRAYLDGAQIVSLDPQNH
jgi:hypothetical protein